MTKTGAEDIPGCTAGTRAIDTSGSEVRFTVRRPGVTRTASLVGS